MSYEMNKLFRVKTLSTYLQVCDICKSSGASICWHFKMTVGSWSTHAGESNWPYTSVWVQYLWAYKRMIFQSN